MKSVFGARILISVAVGAADAENGKISAFGYISSRKLHSVVAGLHFQIGADKSGRVLEDNL